MMVATEVSLPGDSAAADAGAVQGGTEGLDSIDRSASAAALAIANSASVALPVSTPVLQRLGGLWLDSAFAGQGAGAGLATRPEFPLGVFGPASQESTRGPESVLVRCPLPRHASEAVSQGVHKVVGRCIEVLAAGMAPTDADRLVGGLPREPAMIAAARHGSIFGGGSGSAATPGSPASAKPPQSPGRAPQAASGATTTGGQTRSGASAPAPGRDGTGTGAASGGMFARFTAFA